MQIIPLSTSTLDARSLQACLDVLRMGEVVCYPTETFYAFGIDHANEEALSKLYRIKNRAPEKELPLIASDIPMVASICDTGDSRFVALAGKFWPGPLTIVLPSLDRSRTYAIRVSSHPLARQLAEAFGSPLVATSANRSGEPPVQDPGTLDSMIMDEIALLIDGGVTSGGKPSTIVSLVQQPGKILREGAIPANEIVSLL